MQGRFNAFLENIGIHLDRMYNGSSFVRTTQVTRPEHPWKSSRSGNLEDFLDKKTPRDYGRLRPAFFDYGNLPTPLFSYGAF